MVKLFSISNIFEVRKGRYYTLTVIDLDEAALSRNCLYAFCADFANSSASSGLSIGNIIHNQHLTTLVQEFHTQCVLQCLTPHGMDTDIELKN